MQSLKEDRKVSSTLIPGRSARKPPPIKDAVRLMQMRRRLRIVSSSMQSKFRCFPGGCCEVTASAVERHTALDYQNGLFIDDDGVAHPHAWNVDPETGDIYDLTIAQFGERFSNIQRISRTSPIYERYEAGLLAGY